jgi:hypothetical protein
VVCETYGGLHDSIKTRLIKWADLIKKAGSTSGTKELGNSLISMWQRRLSTALLRGRVQLVYNAIDKIAGVPARTNTAAFRITHPVQIKRNLQVTSNTRLSFYLDFTSTGHSNLLANVCWFARKSRVINL